MHIARAFSESANNASKHPAFPYVAPTFLSSNGTEKKLVSCSSSNYFIFTVFYERIQQLFTGEWLYKYFVSSTLKKSSDICRQSVASNAYNMTLRNSPTALYLQPTDNKSFVV